MRVLFVFLVSTFWALTVANPLPEKVPVRPSVDNDVGAEKLTMANSLDGKPKAEANKNFLVYRGRRQAYV